MRLSIFLAGLVALVFSSATQAALIPYTLQGVAGPGLLGGNEVDAGGAPTNPTTPGSGGITAGGIVFDDATNMLTLNVAWGSANGFTDLSGDAIAMHLHSGAQNTAGGVLIGLNGLPGFTASASAGGFSGSVMLDAAQVDLLQSDSIYVNVHTAINGGGEIRGNVTAVPEPASMFACATMTGGLGLMLRRRRRMGSSGKSDND